MNPQETFVYETMMKVAERLKTFFPHHSKCMLDELLVWTMDENKEWTSSPRNMTDQRWNRLADIICSMASLPGTAMPIEARHIRLSALCAGEAARAMARHRFGGKRAFGALELAVAIAEEHSEARKTHRPT